MWCKIKELKIAAEHYKYARERKSRRLKTQAPDNQLIGQVKKWTICGGFRSLSPSLRSHRVRSERRLSPARGNYI